MNITITTSPRRILGSIFSLGLTLFVALSTTAQTPSSSNAAPVLEPLAQAQAAISRQDWARAEAILLPISEAQPRNPFVFYEMARIYENTNRTEAARQIYQGLANIPDAQQRQYAIVVRTPEVSYLTSLVSLSQARLNALNAAAPVVAQAPVTPRAAPSVATLAPPVVTATPSQPPISRVSAASVSAALQGWASAWANKDVPGYISHYVNGYQGEFRSPAAWQKQRTDMIKSKKTIALDIADVQVSTINDNKVQANFKQAYTSDSFTDRANKTLVLVKNAERWLIERETTK